MHKVPSSESKWIFSDNNDFQGLCTGATYSVEHGRGITSILDAFEIDQDMETAHRHQVRGIPISLMATEHNGAFGLMYRPYEDEDFLKRKIEHVERQIADGSPFIAWDDKSFMLIAPLSNERHAKALRSLWSAFQRHDVYIGGAFSDKYTGRGIGFYIASNMPKEEVDALSEKIAEKAETERQIERTAQREGFYELYDVLWQQGKEWFALCPHHLYDDGSVMYWLNPRRQQRDYFGAVTIQDLKDWANDTGKIPGGSKWKR